MRRAHVPGGFKSNAGAVADLGKYQPGSAPEDIEGDAFVHAYGIDKAEAAELSRLRYRERAAGIEGAMITTDNERVVPLIRETFLANGTVLIVGGPSGMFGHIDRLRNVSHHVSDESSHRNDAFNLRPGVRLVLVTRFVSIQLSRNVELTCRMRGVPCVGVYRSPGAVKRHLEAALAATVTTTAATPSITEGEPMSAVRAVPAPVAVASSRPVAPVAAKEPTPTPSTSTSPSTATEERELDALFDDAIAAIELARGATKAAIAKAREHDADADIVRNLKALLGVTK